MKKIVLKTNAKLLILVLFFVQLGAFSQNQLSVPFPDGFIGVRGTSDAQATVTKTFTTLGIAKAFFMQNSSSPTAFDVVSTNVIGSLRLQLISGQLIDIPGSIKWKNNGSTTNYLGFIPSSSFSSVSFSYGASSTYTISGTGTISNIGLGLIGKSTTDFVDNTTVSGNSSGFATELNNYLTTTNLPANKPSGPVTVTALTTTDTTPTVTGTVTLISGESLSVYVNNVVYTAPTIVIVGTAWSLPISSALAIGTYSVVAKITNSSGYTLNDATSNELIIFVVETSSGSVSENSITVFGNISESGSSVTERGFVYATSPNPTTADAKVVSVSGAGAFSQSVSGLLLSTTYYVRVYAINSEGTTFYGSDLSFTTASSISLLNKNGGLTSDPLQAINQYGQIGGNFGLSANGEIVEAKTPLSDVTCTQTWADRNLDVATYSDGTPIPQVTDPTAWKNLTTGAWCYYVKTDGSTDGATYGKLYNWYAVAGIWDEASKTDASLRKKLAPTGYHIPSDTEWTTLSNCLGGATVAGSKMKETGTTHWISPNTDATNSSGFTGLPGGYRFSFGEFYNVGKTGYWWSSTEYNTAYAWIRSLEANNGTVGSYTNDKTNGFSVRCLRD